MLPLLGQKLALAHPGVETAFISACIITAQLVTIPIALLVGWKANSWGRKSLLLIGFGALPIRGALFTVSDNEVWLVSLQVLDGVAAGTLDALIPLVLADVMLGTGRYNAARGVLGTVQGIAGSLSNAAAGFLVVGTGYSATFLALSDGGSSGLVGFAGGNAGNWQERRQSQSSSRTYRLGTLAQATSRQRWLRPVCTP